MESIKSERKGLSEKTKKQLAFSFLMISCLLIVFTTFNFVYPVKAFLLGVFGFMLYPVLLLTILFCLAVLTGNKFVYSIKYLIYLFLSYFFFVCILHICLTGFGSEALSYGEYLTSCYKSVYTPGGLLVSVFTYPITGLLHAVAGIVVYAILFIISIYFIYSYLDGVKQGKIAALPPQPKNYANFNRIANDLEQFELEEKQEEEQTTILEQEESKTLTKINNEEDANIFISDEKQSKEDEEIEEAKKKLGLVHNEEESEEPEKPTSILFGNNSEWANRNFQKDRDDPPKYSHSTGFVKQNPNPVKKDSQIYWESIRKPNLDPTNPIINAETDDYKTLLNRTINNAPIKRDFSLDANQLLVSNKDVATNNNQNNVANQTPNNTFNPNAVNGFNGNNNFNPNGFNGGNNQNNGNNFNPNFNNGVNNFNQNNFNPNNNNFNNNNQNNNQNQPKPPSAETYGIEPFNNKNYVQFNGGSSVNTPNNNVNNGFNNRPSQNQVNNQNNVNGGNNPNYGQYNQNNQNRFNNPNQNGNNRVQNPNQNTQSNNFIVPDDDHIPDFSINIEGISNDYIKPINEKVSPLNPVNFDVNQQKYDKPQEENKTPKFMQNENNPANKTPFDTTKLSDGDIASSLGTTYNLPKSLMPNNVVNGSTYNPNNDPNKNVGPDFSYNSKYVRPPISLLKDYVPQEDLTTNHEHNIEVLERTLDEFRIPAKVEAVRRGASVTRYELHMPAGIPVRKIQAHAGDIAMALAAKGEVRIETPIKGKSAVGIEVPNNQIDTVGLKDIVSSPQFVNSKSPLNFALGKNVDGEVYCCNLQKMPHLLVAGSTGSGKSVCLSSLLVSLFYKTSPEDLRILLVDPKRVEFTMFNNLPHMLLPKAITDSKKALNAMDWLVNEMERRFMLFEECYAKNLEEYNAQPEVQSKKWPKLPYLVLVVDELADLISTAGKKEVEDRIIRLTQKARAAGIHVVIATQRPSVDIITGVIKANLPSRIAFAVTSGVDSKTILDQVGAEQLLGKGDMLYSPSDSEPTRVQGAFVDTPEIKAVVDFIKENNKCYYDEKIAKVIYKENSGSEGALGSARNNEEFDPLMPEALKMVIENKQASASMLQRRFSLGYNRAGRIIDQMEAAKFISSSDGSKPRSVFITMEDYNKIYGGGNNGNF